MRLDFIYIEYREAKLNTRGIRKRCFGKKKVVSKRPFSFSDSTQTFVTLSKSCLSVLKKINSVTKFKALYDSSSYFCLQLFLCIFQIL